MAILFVYLNSKCRERGEAVVCVDGSLECASEGNGCFLDPIGECENPGTWVEDNDGNFICVSNFGCSSASQMIVCIDGSLKCVETECFLESIGDCERPGTIVVDENGNSECKPNLECTGLTVCMDGSLKCFGDFVGPPEQIINIIVDLDCTVGNMCEKIIYEDYFECYFQGFYNESCQCIPVNPCGLNRRAVCVPPGSIECEDVPVPEICSAAFLEMDAIGPMTQDEYERILGETGSTSLLDANGIVLPLDVINEGVRERYAYAFGYRFDLLELWKLASDNKYKAKLKIMESGSHGAYNTELVEGQKFVMVPEKLCVEFRSVNDGRLARFFIEYGSCCKEEAEGLFVRAYDYIRGFFGPPPQRKSNIEIKKKAVPSKEIKKSNTKMRFKKK